jgi:hypothetical protein
MSEHLLDCETCCSIDYKLIILKGLTCCSLKFTAFAFLKVINPHCACQSNTYFTEYSHTQHHSATQLGY